ncbi:MAG TPA: shikimate kinase [Flavobacteriales bacterium]|nr:shikimate kinase [Flavobacteriales bacterium]
MKVFLIGYMASGKSTAAKKLAKNLGVESVDLDAEIVKTAGMSIPEIFKAKGEKGFRKLEQTELRKWIGKDNFVMATGGGTPCFFESMDEMDAAGVTVYLQMTPKAVVDRVQESKQERPILKGLTNEKMLDKVTFQLKKRESFYSRAQWTINGVNLDIEELAGMVSHSK